MTKTQIQKVFAAIALFAIATANFSAVSAATQIGTGSVTGSGAFNTAIMWDDALPGFASGSVSSILIKAQVLPTLDMEISATEINLGTLVAGVASTGSLNIEVGTNAVSGVSITARSQSGGLTNTADANVQINTNTGALDPITGESYTWESTALTWVASDSIFAATFAASGLVADEIDDTVTEHTVYTSNKPEAKTGADDIEFIVSATAQSQTPAGDYEDHVTFSVTGNF